MWWYFFCAILCILLKNVRCMAQTISRRTIFCDFVKRQFFLRNLAYENKKSLTRTVFFEFLLICKIQKTPKNRIFSHIENMVHFVFKFNKNSICCIFLSFSSCENKDFVIF